MKKSTLTLLLTLVVSVSFAQDKVKYSAEERKALGEYLFNPGFDKPATQKVSTLKLKDGTVIKGYCKSIDTKKGQIYELKFTDSVTDEKKEYQADLVAEAILFQANFEKLKKFNSFASGNAFTMMKNISSKKKVVNNDATYFINQKVSLKNKKDEREFLMQLINPEFDDFISVYHDPFAAETKGVSFGGFANMGGGVIKSYYVKKGDKVIWLEKSDFDKEYDFLFGDNAEFMKKYPLKSVQWDWFSALVMEYTKMQLAQKQ